MFNFNYVRATFLALALTALTFGIQAKVERLPSQPGKVSPATQPASSESNSVYYRVRRDLRRCASPLCGGYFINGVNQSLTRCANGRSLPECYVTSINWGGQAEIEPAKALLRGSLETKSNRSGKYGVLRILEAWQAVSSNEAIGAYYRVTDRGLRCVAAPCETHHETKLNTTFSRNVAGVDLAGTGVGENQINEAVAAMLVSEGLLVTGTHVPVSGPGGKSQMLKATQFFLKAKTVVSQKPCMKTGCSGQICADEEVITTCEYRTEYACYKNARCERQSNGNCGFTQTPELTSCLRRR